MYGLIFDETHGTVGTLTLTDALDTSDVFDHLEAAQEAVRTAEGAADVPAESDEDTVGMDELQGIAEELEEVADQLESAFGSEARDGFTLHHEDNLRQAVREWMEELEILTPAAIDFGVATHLNMDGIIHDMKGNGILRYVVIKGQVYWRIG